MKKENMEISFLRRGKNNRTITVEMKKKMKKIFLQK